MKEKGLCAKCIDSKTTWKHSCDKQICDFKECDTLATHEIVDNHEWGVDLYYCAPHVLEVTKIGEQ